jgi:hypothetical protein
MVVTRRDLDKNSFESKVSERVHKQFGTISGAAYDHGDMVETLLTYWEKDHIRRMTNNNNNTNNKDNTTDGAVRKEVQEEEREIEEAEKHRIQLEFLTNIIAAHRYSLRNVISTWQGFDCEIIYLPYHKAPEIDRHFARRFDVRMTSKNATIECIEIREGWGGFGEIWGDQDIRQDRAQQLIERAMGIALALIQIPERYEDQESYFAELAVTAAEDNNKEIVKQQEHNHKLDLEIAELCADVEVEFLEPRMSK